MNSQSSGYHAILLTWSPMRPTYTKPPLRVCSTKPAAPCSTNPTSPQNPPSRSQNSGYQGDRHAFLLTCTPTRPTYTYTHTPLRVCSTKPAAPCSTNPTSPQNPPTHSQNSGYQGDRHAFHLKKRRHNRLELLMIVTKSIGACMRVCVCCLFVCLFVFWFVGWWFVCVCMQVRMSVCLCIHVRMKRRHNRVHRCVHARVCWFVGWFVCCMCAYVCMSVCLCMHCAWVLTE
jgi:hypothetical protein